MNRFEVIVGNIGTVYDGPSQSTAWLAFEEYVSQSTEGKGRASGEAVYCICDDDVLWEHMP